MNPPSAPLPDIVAGNTAFAFDLYRQLGKREGNIFCSPLSISTALAMTSAGAQGPTLEEMVKTLHLPENQEQMHPAFAALMHGLTEPAKSGEYELRIANALWAQSGYQIREAFLDVVRTNYGAGFQTVDFRQNPEAARQTVNRWVEQQTNDKIKELFPSGVIDTLTRLVLTNAIYFKGLWTRTFDKRMTYDEPFHSAGSSAKVPMMHKTTDLSYAEGDTWQAIQLPYKASRLAMIVVLPKKVDGLPDLESKLDRGRLMSIVGALHSERVSLTVPRFKALSEFSLNQALQELGLKLAFSQTSADFRRITAEDPLRIQAVLHKAYVDVNEEGSEAAAATGVAIGVKATDRPPDPPKIFKADHPFFFAIRDTSAGSLLFLGRLAKPA
jgi:serpin B